MPPIWVINLRRSTDRRAYMTAQLDSLGLTYEMIEAVDGRELSREDLAARYRPEESRALPGFAMTPGEVAISLSHQKLYRRLLDLGLDEVVILEDDAFLPPAFLDVLNRRHALPDDWELVLLYRKEGQASHWGGRPLDQRHRCVRLAGRALGAQAYLLRPSGARKLIAFNDPVRVVADDWTGSSFRTGIRIYAIDPPCAGEWFPEDPAHSTIPEAYSVRLRWPTRQEFGPILWLAHKCKWGLIHFCQRWNPLSRI